jgi:CheY-like chemotaxis protein
LGEGTSFFFSIPYNPPSALAIPFQRNIKKVDQIINNTKRKLVLVVDDDHYSSLLIKEFLRPLDCKIEFVNNGKDAIEFIKSNPETMLVLMDIQLPYMDGYEATSEIRKFNLKIPIIAQTANVMIGDREKAIAAGCNDYLSKPLDVYKLHEIVKFYLS